MSALLLAHSAIIAAWWGMLAYWFVSARHAAPHADPAKARRDLLARIVFGVAIAGLVTLSLRLPDMRALQRLVLASLPLALAGAAMTMAGAALAIAARRRLGRNWGMPGSRKQDTELVTMGPYAHIRHPIYTGVLLMALGSSIGLTPAWAVALLLMTAYFIWNARREEAIMLERFPDTYPLYRARTAMIVPYLL